VPETRGLAGKVRRQGYEIGHAKIRRWGLSHISPQHPHAAVLDIGCGGGAALRDMASFFPNSKLYGIDYSPDMVSLASRVNKRLIGDGRIEVSQGTVSSLPFSDNFFSLATAFESYYFWPDLIHDLEEIRRVLKPGGTLLLVNEVYEDKKFYVRNQRWVAWANMQVHSPQGYRDLLSASGYIAIEIEEVPEKNWIAARGKKNTIRKSES
jgi:ubiquinone/menaquinone biosynthesis C-methylase UbiE